VDHRQPIDNKASATMILLCLIWSFQQIALKAVAADITPIMQIALRSTGAARDLRKDTPYPYRLHLEQHRLTPILLQHVLRTGLVEVVFGHRFEAQHSQGEQLVVQALGPNGLVEWTTSWLIFGSKISSTSCSSNIIM
jgi:2-polyprenyl-6-methoxyphenol hydroxylase-like FAD-dependent oxidoreductase